MAASSIAHTIVISDPKQVEAFADAVEEASRSPLGPVQTPV